MSFMPSGFMPSALAANSCPNGTDGFMSVLSNSSDLINFLGHNQVQQDSKVNGDVIYAWERLGSDAENALRSILRSTMGKFDSRLGNGISPFWTFHIRVARCFNTKWGAYAATLPPGENTIKVRTPSNWAGNRITRWNDVKEVKVLVY